METTKYILYRGEALNAQNTLYFLRAIGFEKMPLPKGAERIGIYNVRTYNVDNFIDIVNGFRGSQEGMLERIKEIAEEEP